MQARLAWMAWLGMLCATATGAADTPGSLGGSPLCEASAAVAVPCADGDGRCVLVADNEVRDRLFRFRLGGTGLDVLSREPVVFAHLLGGLADDPGEISDIEALAVGPDTRLLLLGSHSRNTQCEQRPDRRRLLVAHYRDGRLQAADPPREPAPEPDCDTLFVDAVRAAPEVRHVCAAIAAAEIAADAAARKGSKKQRIEACRAALPLNAEGAVTLTQPGGRVETWVGLRAPLVDGQAVLLRQAGDADRFVFDAVVLVDLGGRGVRELTLDGDTVSGIAGPPEDATVDFELWRLPATALLPAARLRGERVTLLPTSSEGLAIIDGRAFVFIDGDEGEPECVTPARYVTIDLGR